MNILLTTGLFIRNSNISSNGVSLSLSITEGKLPSLLFFSISVPLPCHPSSNFRSQYLYLSSIFSNALFINSNPVPRYFARHIINRRPQCSRLVVDHSVHVGRHFYSSMNINISIIAGISHIQPVSIHPYCLINIIYLINGTNTITTDPANSATSTTSPAPPPTFQLPSEDTDRSSAEVICEAARTCVDPGFIFVTTSDMASQERDGVSAQEEQAVCSVSARR